MHLSDATWTDAEGLDTDLSLLPVGATEQHGPHAPLSTDTITAEAVAAAGAEAYGGEVTVAPALPVGVSEEHHGFAGTLWLRHDTFRSAVRDAARSLAHHGWDRIVLVNGHGGNADALREVAADLSRHDGAYAAAFTWFEALEEYPGEMGHAGAVETAMVRHHRPDLVREDRIEDARGGAAEGWGEWASGVNLAHDVSEFAENGVVGDPGAGDADYGADLTERAGDALADLLEAVADR